MTEPSASPSSWGFTPIRVGRRIQHFRQVDSTNNVAHHHAHDPANDGLIIVADVQTAGRGRLGRSWSSPPEDGILMSLVLFPPDPLRRPALLTILSAVAVCQTIQDTTGLNAAIKWPNDVYLRGKKVCGILVEQSCGPGEPAAIIGIGLNVNTRAEVFAAAGLDQAGSLAMFHPQPLDRQDVFARLVACLDEAYGQALQGDLTDLEARWRWHSGLLGRQVQLTARGETHTGRLLDLGFDGILIVGDQGEHLGFAPEVVTELKPLEQ